MACRREIVIHSEKNVGTNWRSQGCPAVKPKERKEVQGQLEGGTLVCAYREGKYSDQAPVLKSTKKKKKISKKRGHGGKTKAKSHRRRHRR
jgi:hypothetical protein